MNIFFNRINNRLENSMRFHCIIEAQLGFCIQVVTMLLTLLGPSFFDITSEVLTGGTTTGLAFLEAENFFLFFFSNAKPCAMPWSSLSTCWSGTSRLGLESLRLTDPFSSDGGVLLWLREWLCPLSWQLLHTESSDRDRPMRRETFPVLAASMRVPHRRLWELLLLSNLRNCFSVT